MNTPTLYDPWDLASYDAHSAHVAAYNAEKFAPISATITPRFTATRTAAQQAAIDSNNCDAIFALNSFTNYHLGE
jgi:hypothetical protein